MSQMVPRPRLIEANLKDVFMTCRFPRSRYEGAVYMHEGQTYVVQQCDTSKHFAKVQRNDVSYYTEPRDHTRVSILGRTGATGF